MWNIFTRDSSKDFPFEVTECPNYKFNEKSLWKLNKGRKKVINCNFLNVSFIYKLKLINALFFSNFFIILISLYYLNSSLIEDLP